MIKKVFVSKEDYFKFLNNPDGVAIETSHHAPILVKKEQPEYKYKHPKTGCCTRLKGDVPCEPISSGRCKSCNPTKFIHDHVQTAYGMLVSAVNGTPVNVDIDLLKLEVNGAIKILKEVLDE